MLTVAIKASGLSEPDGQHSGMLATELQPLKEVYQQTGILLGWCAQRLEVKSIQYMKDERGPAASGERRFIQGVTGAQRRISDIVCRSTIQVQDIISQITRFSQILAGKI